jgi:hypothetical protein
MNKRIQELAELCYEVKPSMVENSQKIGNDGVPLYSEVFNQEKFAKLIVKECLDACSRANEIRHFVPPTQQQVVLSCMREIEKHFGVE